MVRSDNGERCWTDGEQISGQKNWVETGTTALPAGWTGTVSGASPLFVDAANHDFRPTAGSPLLEQGTATSTSPPGFPFPNPLALPAFEPPSTASSPAPGAGKESSAARSTSAPMSSGFNLRQQLGGAELEPLERRSSVGGPASAVQVLVNRRLLPAGRWLGRRDSNPDSAVQSRMSYR